MELMLEIISHQRYTMPEENSRFLFTATGGSIGRNANNDWTVDDPERLMSSQHSTIYFENNRFHIVDTSTNGLFVNQNQTPLGTDKHVIANGDQFTMGQYQFLATLIANNDKAIYTPMHSNNTREDKQRLAMDDMLFPLIPETVNHGSDPLNHFDDQFIPGRMSKQDIVSDSNPVSDILDPVPDTHSYFNLPNAIPENWLLGHDHTNTDGDNKQPDTRQESTIVSDIEQQFDTQVGSFEDFQKDFKADDPEPESFTSNNDVSLEKNRENQKTISETTASGADDIQKHNGTYAELSDSDSALTELLLQVLEIDSKDINKEQMPELVKNIALIAKLSMSGLMQTMLARTHLKNEFRMSRTTVKAQENNPLKFCINYQQLTHYLLVNPMAGYLQADQAIKESFAELQEHQIGVMAGMKAALMHMLNKISPDKISDKVVRGRSNSIPVLNKKGRCWDAYSDLYNDMLEEDDVFYHLFANEFCKAYDNQIEHVRHSKKLQ